MARLFDYDPVTKTKQLFHWNEADESFHIETLQDVSDIVETNKGLYNLHDERSGWKGDLHHVGSIPMSLYYDLIRSGEIGTDGKCESKKLLKFLNNRDNLAWRTRPGTL